MSTEDYITGEKFIKVADFVFAPKDKIDDYNPIVNTFCHCALKEVNIVYTHTKYVKDLFKQISGLKCKFIIVTHNCDENVDFLPPTNVIQWFTQNVAVKSSRVESIPIGLENDRWFKSLRKKEKMEAKFRTPRKEKNLVYMNHNVNTNPFERVPIYDLLQDKSWVTTEKGVNGKGFDEYLDNIYNHKYVICPQGNGVDTHRLWETLYMGSIPIVKKDINNWFYHDLPILYVHRWDEVKKEMLEDMYDTYYYGEWDKEILTFEYWKNKILGWKN